MDIPLLRKSDSLCNSVPHSFFHFNKRSNATSGIQIGKKRRFSSDNPSKIIQISNILPPSLPIISPKQYIPPQFFEYPEIPPRTDLGEEAKKENIDNDEENLTVTNVKQNRICHPTEEQICFLQKGSFFYMLTKKGKLKEVCVSMPGNGNYIEIKVKKSNKILDTIQLHNINSIERGCTTSSFIQYSEIAGDELLCMSICSKINIDLIAENEELVNKWYHALVIVVEMYKRLQC